MCGIIGIIGQANITHLLLNQLALLEYRGYDSAGMAYLDSNNEMCVYKSLGKVHNLSKKLKDHNLYGMIGLAHTRWATHGKPEEKNAHPHSSGDITLVHNGIIDNHEALRVELLEKGYCFSSDTDTEVIVHLIHSYLHTQDNSVLQAVQSAMQRLKGAYALAIISKNSPEQLIAVRKGSPLMIGVGKQYNIVASDQRALAGKTDYSVSLNDDELVVSKLGAELAFYDINLNPIKKALMPIEDIESSVLVLNEYKHFMHKEIYEQPKVIAKALDVFLSEKYELKKSMLKKISSQKLNGVRAIHIVACGTSFNAGMVASRWFEQIAGISSQVFLASEFTYSPPLIPDGTLCLGISQSGETADTLSAIRIAKKKSYVACLAICNVFYSQLSREVDDFMLTYAGTEVGVASTKAFTTQLIVLYLFVIFIAQERNILQSEISVLLRPLQELVKKIQINLLLESHIQTWAKQIHHKKNMFYLARGQYVALAEEGALKIKEVSYIHAEAYAAGELKHGPLALIDEGMPIVVLMPNQGILIDKIQTNIKEILSRGGEVFLLKDKNIKFTATVGVHVIDVDGINEALDPILYTLPLQLLAYHVGLYKGTDIDQPRNLAKSVTVE